MRHDLVNTEMPSSHGRIVGILSHLGGNRMMLFFNSLSARGLASYLPELRHSLPDCLRNRVRGQGA